MISFMSDTYNLKSSEYFYVFSPIDYTINFKCVIETSREGMESLDLHRSIPETLTAVSIESKFFIL